MDDRNRRALLHRAAVEGEGSVQVVSAKGAEQESHATVAARLATSTRSASRSIKQSTNVEHLGAETGIASIAGRMSTGCRSANMRI